MQIITYKPEWNELVELMKANSDDNGQDATVYFSDSAEADTETVVTISEHFKGNIQQLDAEYIDRNKLFSYRLRSKQ